jgi:hypothetical protein
MEIKNMTRSPTKSNLESNNGEEFDEEEFDNELKKLKRQRQQSFLPLILKKAKDRRNLAKLKFNKEILSLPLVNLLSISSEVNENKNQIEYYIEDWSRETCNRIIISPIKQFLSVQHSREHSSRRRCMQIETRRNDENNRHYVENSLREFDDRVNLNMLLKKNKLGALAKNQLSTSTSCLPNYKAILAREILKRNASCHRCVERNKKYDEKVIKNLVNSNSNKRTVALRK